MNIKIISVGIGLVFLLAIFPNVASEDYRFEFRMLPDHYFHGSIWLYPNENITTGQPGLDFYPNFDYIFYRGDYDDFFFEGDFFFLDDEEYRWVDEIIIGSGEAVNLSISELSNRNYNPEIEMKLFTSYPFYPYSDIAVNYRLKCDGDGDGIFEYIAIFPENPSYYSEVEPISTMGEPKDMTNGTILLQISNSGDDSVILEGGTYGTYLQVPFDIDFDSDGIGDYSDPDDDNDGHPDRVDVFSINSKEWQDSDWDGIGDNQDEDNNGNGIPDDFELPLALCILLIPFLVIFFILRIHKKKSDSGKGGESEAPQITDPKSGLKNW
jgi:hypothetical protein